MANALAVARKVPVQAQGPNPAASASPLAGPPLPTGVQPPKGVMAPPAPVADGVGDLPNKTGSYGIGLSPGALAMIAAARQNAAGNKGAKPDPGAQFLQAMAGATGAGPDYNSQFQQSLAASRQSIQTQIANATAEVNRQQETQMAETGQLPAQYTGLLNSTLSGLNHNAQQAQAAQEKTGLGSFTPAGTTEAPMADAARMATGFEKSGVPLIQLGVQDQAMRNKGQIAQTGMEMNNQLDQEGRAYDANAAQQKEQEHFQTIQAVLQAGMQKAAAKNDFAQQVKLAQMGYQHDSEQFKQQLTLSQLQHQQSLWDDSSKMLAAGGVPLNGQQADSMRRSPLYGDLVNYMQNGGDDTKWLKDHGYDNKIAGQGLKNFLDNLRSLVAFDLVPKNGAGTPKPPTGSAL